MLWKKNKPKKNIHVDTLEIEKMVIDVYERFLYHKALNQNDISIFDKYIIETGGEKPYSLLEKPENAGLKFRILKCLFERYSNTPNDDYIKSLEPYIRINWCYETFYDGECEEYFPPFEICRVRIIDKNNKVIEVVEKPFSLVECDLLENGWEFVRETDTGSLIYYKKQK